MTREQLLEKSLESLREIAKAQGVKSITKYRKAELVEIIMNGGIVAKTSRFSVLTVNSVKCLIPLPPQERSKLPKLQRMQELPPLFPKPRSPLPAHSPLPHPRNRSPLPPLQNSVGTNTRSDPNTRSDL